MEAETRKAQGDAAHKAEGEADMNQAMNGDKKRKKKGSQSRSPSSALTELGMPSLVQKAWHALTRFEVDFFGNHPHPTTDEAVDPAEQQFAGWTYKEDKKEWAKVDRHMPSEYEEMLEEAEAGSDTRDFYKMYIEWSETQLPMVRSKLAILLTEIHSVPGVDTTQKGEMGEMAAAMERAAGAQAAAMQQAALARERANREKVQARAQEKKEQREEDRERLASEMQERKEQRGADAAERSAARAAEAQQSDKIFSAVASALQMLPQLVHPQGQAPAPTPAAAPAQAAAPAGRSSTAQFATIEALLESIPKFTGTMTTELLAKFDEQMVDLSDLRSTYELGGTATLDEVLKSISPIAGVRIKIINALLGSRAA